MDDNDKPVFNRTELGLSLLRSIVTGVACITCSRSEMICADRSLIITITESLHQAMIDHDHESLPRGNSLLRKTICL